MMIATRTRNPGFTLIELLVVVSVLGVLMAVLVPQLFLQQSSAKVGECEHLIRELKAVAMNHDSETGDYPKDSLDQFDSKWRLHRNGENEGIEALLIDISLAGTGRNFLEEVHSDQLLANGDGDRAGVSLGQLGEREQYELVDPWGMPLVYFHHRGYGKVQQVNDGTGEVHSVNAVKDHRGRYIEARRFQIISAGLDGEFGTDDDIYNFAKSGK